MLLRLSECVVQCLQEYRLVELVRGGSDEYTWVAALFHQSMTRPRAQILSIKRVQNQILWQFYMVYVFDLFCVSI